MSLLFFAQSAAQASAVQMAQGAVESDMKFWAQLVTQTAFPIVLILFVVYFGFKYGVPRLALAAEKISDDFRTEMKEQRETDAQNLERLYKVHQTHADRIEAKVDSKGEQVIDYIKEKCAGKAG